MAQLTSKVLLLCDTRGWFWKKYNDRNQTESLDITVMCSAFESAGFEVEVANVALLDFSKAYQGTYILYTSSEDFNEGSKSFIEDVLVWLELRGAILVPSFPFFRAHHNKVMMELLRQSFSDPRLNTIKSEFYPSRKIALEANHSWPAVLKSASGAGSQGVALVQSKSHLSSITRKLARLRGSDFATIFTIRNFIRALTRQGPINFHNSKFVIQNFIPNMTGDYKVLAFSSHFFVLHRRNRQNDFRASGSGQFVDVNPDEIQGVLEFARHCTCVIDSPFLSLDIGFDGTNHHLVEFQCVSFGLKALTLSSGYYECDETGYWQFIKRKSVPEYEFVTAFCDYIRRKQGHSIVG